MRNTIVLGIAVLGFGMLVGCGGVAIGTANVSAGAMHPEGSFDGVFHSPAYGRMEFTQDGNKLVGLYEGERHFGRIEGHVNGNLLNFTWTQWKEDLNGKVREKSGRGYFKYSVVEEGTTEKKRLAHFLKGEWGYGDQNAGNKWDAVKLPKKAKKILKPHDIGEPTGVMDDDYAASAGFGVTEEGPEEDAEVGLSEPKEEKPEEDDGIDGLF